MSYYRESYVFDQDVDQDIAALTAPANGEMSNRRRRNSGVQSTIAAAAATARRHSGVNIADDVKALKAAGFSDLVAALCPAGVVCE